MRGDAPTNSIVYVVQMPISERDYTRFQFRELIEAGVGVSVIDASAVVMRGVAHDRSDFPKFADLGMHVVANPAELRVVQPVLDRADLVVCHVGSGFLHPDNRAVLRLVSHSPTPYAIFCNNAIPLWNRAVARKSILTRLANMKPAVTLINRLPLWSLGVRRANFAIHGGENSRIPMRLIGPKTTPVWTHCNDYQIYRQTEPAAETEPTVVFIDQNLGFHPGATAPGFRQSVTVSEFYPTLRRLFDRLETELSLRVIIAAHPRAHYDEHPGLFGAREIVHGRTAELLARCRLAMCSYSTAANLAVLAGKPMLIYTTPSIRRTDYIQTAPEALARALGTVAHDISDPESVSLTDILAYDEAAYDGFLEAYIKTDRAPDIPIWQTLVELCRTGRAGHAMDNSEDTHHT